MKDYKRLTKRAGWHKDIDLTDELGYSYIYQRLAELENSIEDKKLVELPFSIGENVFIIDEYKVKKGVINGVWLQNTALIEIRHSKGKYGWQYAQRLENEIFLTKGEAQNVLKEIIGEEENGEIV